MNPNEKEIKISEIFYSVQGEIDIGVPSIFVRLSGCNLLQSDKGCDWCDTRYAEEGTFITIDEVVKKILWTSAISPSFENDCKNIVVTGGEPLLQKEALYFLINALKKEDGRFSFRLETNGTLYPPYLYLFQYVSCSSKKQRYDLGIIDSFKDWPGIRFKFVYERGKERWWEKIITALDIPHNKVWIMPEGRTRAEQLESMAEVIEYCKTECFNFSPRLHILVWDSKKGV